MEQMIHFGEEPSVMVGWRPLKDNPEDSLIKDFIMLTTYLFPHLFPYLTVPTPLNPLRSVHLKG